MRRIILRVLIAVITLIIGVGATYVWLLKPLLMTKILEVGKPVPSEMQSHPDRPLGWDLTYVSALERNDVARSELIWKWLDDHPRSPARRWISEWQGDPIVSSMLFEFPFPHAAERTTVWMFRTKERAYLWWYGEKCAGCRQPDPRNDWAIDDKREMPPQVYDELFAEVYAWQQAELPGVEEIPNEYSLGYMGFLSLYKEGQSRQMLLDWKDIIGQKNSESSCNTPECRKRRMGRVFRIVLHDYMKSVE